MDEIRERHERTASQTFITWYNRENRKAFEFVPQDCRGSGLTFRAGDHEVRAALTIAYYDYLDEQIRWLHGRDAPAALKIRIGFDLQAALVQTINDEIANQCAMESAPGRKLLIYVLPTVTTTTMMCEVLERRRSGA